jgi:hypothetical protein
MNPTEKRRIENELVTMGLPGLDDPALVQVMADIVNGYPVVQERVEFFCDLLNECEGSKRREMYEAMRPRLTIDVPPLDVCEARIAAKAERLIRPKSKLPAAKAEAVDAQGAYVDIWCGHCEKKARFIGSTVTDAMGAARKAGWGRGPKPGLEYCASCRLMALLPAGPGAGLTRRNG